VTKLEALNERVTKLEALEERITKLEAWLQVQGTDLTNQVTSAKTQTIMAQNGKNNNLLVYGIDETEDENAVELVLTMASKLSAKMGKFYGKKSGKSQSGQRQAHSSVL
jgi:hypothetical protein